MLVLSRKIGEKIIIGDNVTLTITRIAGDRVSLGFEAPKNVRILRSELKKVVEQFDEPQQASRTNEFAPPLEMSGGLEDGYSAAYLPRLAR